MAKINSISNTQTGRRFTLSTTCTGGIRMAWQDGDSIQSVIVTKEHFRALCAHPAMQIGRE
jgi:Ni,Fe-hydrogenase III large subunit